VRAHGTRRFDIALPTRRVPFRCLGSGLSGVNWYTNGGMEFGECESTMWGCYMDLDQASVPRYEQ
jgi:hypothetical protein